MPVPRSLKLSESELPSFAQLDHQLAAAAQPGTSIRDLLEDENPKSEQQPDSQSSGRSEH